MAKLSKIKNGLQTVKFEIEDLDGYVILKGCSFSAFYELQELFDKHSKKSKSKKEEKDKVETMAFIKDAVEWIRGNLPSLIVVHNFDDAENNKDVVETLLSDYDISINLITEYFNFLGVLKGKNKS